MAELVARHAEPDHVERAIVVIVVRVNRKLRAVA